MTTTTTRIRKNASLEAIARETVTRSNRAYRYWIQASDAFGELEWNSPGRQATKQTENHAWDRYTDLREIAEQLARLADIEGPKRPGDKI